MDSAQRPQVAVTHDDDWMPAAVAATGQEDGHDGRPAAGVDRAPGLEDPEGVVVVAPAAAAGRS